MASGIVFQSIVPMLKAGFEKKESHEQVGSHWRFVMKTGVPAIFTYEDINASGAKQAATNFSTQLIPVLEKMNEAFVQAEISNDINTLPNLIATLKKIEQYVESAFNGWKTKTGIIHWIKLWWFGNTVEKAKLTFQLTINKKIQEAQDCLKSAKEQELAQVRASIPKHESKKSPDVPDEEVKRRVEAAREEERKSAQLRISELNGRVQNLTAQVQKLEKSQGISEEEVKRRIEAARVEERQRMKSPSDATTNEESDLARLIRTTRQTSQSLERPQQQRDDFSDLKKIAALLKNPTSNPVDRLITAAQEIKTPQKPMDFNELRELVESLANATLDVKAPIHELFSEMEQLDSEDIEEKVVNGFYKTVMALLTPAALRANPKIIEAIRKFISSHFNTQLFPMLTLQLPNGPSVKINRILGCALSFYFESIFSRWSAGQPDVVTIQIDGYDLTLTVLESIRGYINSGFVLQGDPVTLFRVGDYLQIDSLKQTCRRDLKCEGYPALSKLALLAIDCRDAELKVLCLDFLKERKFQYPTLTQLPDEFALLSKDYQEIHETMSFKFPKERDSYQKFESYTETNYIQATLYQMSSKAIDFCKKLGIEEIEIANSFSEQGMGSKLKEFKSVRMPYDHRIGDSDNILLEFASSSSLVKLRLDSVPCSSRTRKAFLDKLASNTVLRSLDLANTTICETNMDDLANSFGKNTTLQYLRLEVSRTNSQMMKKLGEALQKNTGLRAIMLSYDNGENIPKQEFFEALKTRTLPLEVSSNGLDKNVRVGKGAIEYFSRQGW